MKSIYFNINEGIIDKKVLLFDNEKLLYDLSKDNEFWDTRFDSINRYKKPPIILSAEKISRQKLIKANPQLVSDSTIVIERLDPISGDPVVYDKKRIKAFYNAWKKEFLYDKKVIREVDQDSSSSFVFIDEILGKKVYVVVHTQFKNNKALMIVRDMGEVRTKKHPFSSSTVYAYLLPEYKPFWNWYKIYRLKKFKANMESISINFMNFILNDGDFIYRAINHSINYYPTYNF